MASSQNIKVCMIVHQMYMVDARVRNYAEGLAQCDVQVDVICASSSNTPSSINQKIRLYPIPITRSSSHKRIPWSEYLFSFAHYSWKLLKLFIRNKYQVIHIHNMPNFLIFTAFIPKLLGAKLILDIHDTMPEFYTAKFGANAHKFFIPVLKLEERISSQFADHILTANNNFKRTISERGIPANKITVINNIPDPKIFNRANYAAERSAKRDTFTLIYPGTIAPRYGLDTAIRAMPDLIKKISNIRLIIIGNVSAFSQELIELAKNLNVSSFVSISPPIPLEKVPEAMAKADIGIYPAIPDAHMTIAAPGKVMEYAVMGLPIVSSRVRVVEDMFSTEAALYHDPGNVEQFIQCILEIYHNPSLKARLVEKADEEFVQVHTWINEQQLYHEVINRLVPNKNKPIRFN